MRRLEWLVVLLVALPGLARPVPARAQVARLHNGIVSGEIRGAAIPTDRRIYEVGHLTLDLSDGDLRPVWADDRLVGLFFEGDGRFTYESDDLVESNNFRVNVKRATKYSVESNAIADSLSRVLIYDSRLASGAVESGSSDSGAEDLQESLAKHLRRFGNDRFISTTTLAAQSQIEPSRPVVVIQIEAARNDLTYVHDGLRTGVERLAVMHPFLAGDSFKDSRYPEVLSVQALSGTRLERQPPRFVVREIDIDLLNHDAESLDLDVLETIEASEPLQSLSLDLWTQTYLKGETFPYELESVELEDGTPVDYLHHHDEVLISLPGGVSPGERIRLRFRIGGEALHRPGGHSFWWLPISDWLPMPARLDQRSFTYKAKVRVAKPFVPFSMGKTVRRWEEDDLAGIEVELDKPIQFPVVLAGKYHSYTEEQDGLTITLSSYAYSHDDPMRKIAHNVFELVRIFERYLGEFPFEELNIIQINAYGFGIAPPGVIYLTSEAFDPSPAGRAYRSELNSRMAHEVAHQWWGNVVQMAGMEEQWLSESTAEYYAAVAIGHVLGKARFKKYFQTWKSQASDLKDYSSIFLANQVTGDKAFYDRYNLLYAQGPLVLHDLREEIGDEAFFTIMKSFITNFRFRHVGTLDFVQLTNFITKADYRAWFQENLFGLPQ